MLRRTVNVAMVVFLLLSVVLVASVAAEVSGPDAPMVPTGEWTELLPGQLHWYAFTYDFDEDDTDEPVVIRLYAEPYESTVLTVRNQEQIKLWKDEGEEEHFGCCTNVDRDRDHDGQSDYMEWGGILTESGTYYVVVETAEGKDETAYYRMVLDGPNISLPMAAAEPAVAPAEEPLVAEVPTAEQVPIEVAGLEGTSPFFAMQPTSNWIKLDEGGEHWYVFEYDDDDDWTIPAKVKLLMEPSEGAILSLHNGQQARIWEQDGELVHFGCCTMVDEDENDDGVLDYAMWAGDLGSSGRYYIVVKHAENIDGPVFYQFTLTGDGIQF
jgi:hypothetical protein